MVMSVNPGISTTDARAKGFEDAVKEDSKFPYLGVQYSKNDPATAANLIGSALAKRVERGAALLQEWLQTIHDLEGTHFAGALYSALGKYSRPLTEAGSKVVAVLQECEPDRTHSLTR